MNLTIPDYGHNLNVAAICQATAALGPGLRSVVWVQGCALNCPSCIAQDWIPFKTVRIVDPEILANELLINHDVTGITISGGEPMLQAKGLLKLVQAVKSQRDINVLVYTGFRYENLMSIPPNNSVIPFINAIDALIDGPYIQKMNDNKGLRGSSNQRLIFLTEKLYGFQIDQTPRKVEVKVFDGQLFIVGVPDQASMHSFDVLSSRLSVQR